MGKKKAVHKKVSKPGIAGKGKAAPVRRSAGSQDPLIAPMKGATSREIGHVQLEVARAGTARVKRMIYPTGFRWSVDMKPVVGTALCMHAHVGFLARGEIHFGIVTVGEWTIEQTFAALEAFLERTEDIDLLNQFVALEEP